MTRTVAILIYNFFHLQYIRSRGREILSPESGEILFSESVNSHQVNVSVLFPLELFATHVTRSVHVQLHVGVELNYN